MRIVVDVMGGDHGCDVVIEGVKIGLQAHEKISELYLVGDETQIQTALTRTRATRLNLILILRPWFRMCPVPMK